MRRLFTAGLAGVVFALAGLACKVAIDPVDTPIPPTISAVVGVNPAGIATGMTQWPQAKWCSGPLNGTRLSVSPATIVPTLSAARLCGERVAINIPRNQETSDGTGSGCYSQTKAFAEVDALAKAISPAAVAGFVQDGTLIDLMAIDEPQTGTWCGKVIPWSTVAALTQKVKQTWPAMPVLVRSTPSFLSQYKDWNGSLDVGAVVWNTKRGDPKALWDKQWTVAQAMGIKMETGIFVDDCNGVFTAPCSASIVKSVGKIALDHPGTCAFISWKFNPDTWKKSDIQDAWNYLATYAASKPTRYCRRV